MSRIYDYLKLRLVADRIVSGDYVRFPPSGEMWTMIYEAGAWLLRSGHGTHKHVHGYADIIRFIDAIEAYGAALADQSASGRP